MSRTHRLRRRRGRGRPRNTAFLALLVVLVGAVVAGLSLVGYVVSVAASAPPLDALKARDPGQSSQVFAADGTRLGFIQANDLRMPVDGSKLPKTLKDATVAIEDQRFYRHHGVDYEGVVRAAVKNVTSGKTVQGGSTLTMQLVRNLYISNERTYKRKIREAKLAEELENEHDKAWILDAYLNSVPYGTVGGQTAVGAEAAARVYFGKPAKDLTLRESALLAGLPQAPSAYGPFLNGAGAKARRNEVLAKMADLGYITRARAEKTMRKGLGLDRGSRYFTARRERYFFDYVKDELLKEYGAKRVNQGGLKVYTTIDLDKQQEARAALRSQLGGLGPSGAIVTINPRNGYIEAMASSADYGKSKFNLAAQGHRQAGSTFKVMALMTALRRGVNPNATYYISRSPTLIDDPRWGKIKVETYGGKGAGRLNLVQATLKSDNSVYIQLALDLGPEEIKKTAWDMGIRSKLEGLPSETLGGLKQGVSPLEMANAYATIASGGIRHRPTAIRKVVLPDGKTDTPPRFKVKGTRAFPESVTAEATKILEMNMQRGTATAAQIGCPAAAKTGTTDNFTDAWLVGYTPRLATAVWIGYPARQVQMLTENYGGPVNGGSIPARVWGAYMRQAKGSYCGPFPTPSQPFVSVPFSGRYATSGGQLLQGGDQGPGLGGTGTDYTPAVPQPEPNTQGAPPAGGGDGTTRAPASAGGGTASPGGGTAFDPRAYDSPRAGR
jgi:penicillin-binding protein 1A